MCVVILLFEFAVWNLLGGIKKIKSSLPLPAAAGAPACRRQKVYHLTVSGSPPNKDNHAQLGDRLLQF